MSDDAIDVYLNAAYRYGIPSVIPGHLTEGTWTVTTVDGTADYDYDVEVYEVRNGSRIGTYRLSEYFRKDQFEQDHSSTANEQKPYAVLFYGRVATFYPTPDTAYTVTIPARLYPSADLTSSGLENHNHAMAVVCEATREFLVDQDEIEKANNIAGDLAVYLSRLRSQSLGRARERRARLSF